MSTYKKSMLFTASLVLFVFLFNPSTIAETTGGPGKLTFSSKMGEGTQPETDFVIDQFDEIYAWLKLPKALSNYANKNEDRFSVGVRFQKAGTSEVIKYSEFFGPFVGSEDETQFGFVVFSRVDPGKGILNPPTLKNAVKGVPAKKAIPIQLTINVAKPTKFKEVTRWDDWQKAIITEKVPSQYTDTPLASETFNIVIPEGGAEKVVASDDGRVSIEYPLYGPWMLKSKSADTIILAYGGVFKGEIRPTFTISQNYVGEKADARAAEQEYLEALRKYLMNLAKQQFGEGYFSESDFTIYDHITSKPISGVTPLEFNVSFTRPHPKKSGEKEYGYKSWKGYAIYKDGYIYTLTLEVAEPEFDDEFEELSYSVKIQ